MTKGQSVSLYHAGTVDRHPNLSNNFSALLVGLRRIAWRLAFPLPLVQSAGPVSARLSTYHTTNLSPLPHDHDSIFPRPTFTIRADCTIGNDQYPDIFALGRQRASGRARERERERLKEDSGRDCRFPPQESISRRKGLEQTSSLRLEVDWLGFSNRRPTTHHLLRASGLLH